MSKPEKDKRREKFPTSTVEKKPKTSMAQRARGDLQSEEGKKSGVKRKN